MKKSKWSFQFVPSLNSSSGFGLLNVMLYSAIFAVISTSILSVVTESNKTLNYTRAKFEYDQFILNAKSEINFNRNCQEIVGLGTALPDGVRFPPENDPVRGITIGGVKYTDGGNIKVPGSALIINRVEIAPGSAEPMPYKIDPKAIDGNLAVFTPIDYDRIQSNLRFTARTAGITGVALRPIEIPVTIFRRHDNLQVAVCAADEANDRCTSVNGVLLPQDIPSKDLNGDNFITMADADGDFDCDVRTTIGGCAVGGNYSKTDNACTAQNPYTGACSCPPDTPQYKYTAVETINYTPNKRADIHQYSCLSCAPNINPANASANNSIDINMDQMMFDYLCAIQDPSCPCVADPTSAECICSTNPYDAQCAGKCDDPNGLYYDTCPCLAQRDTVASDVYEQTCLECADPTVLPDYDTCYCNKQRDPTYICP